MMTLISRPAETLTRKVSVEKRPKAKRKGCKGKIVVSSDQINKKNLPGLVLTKTGQTPVMISCPQINSKNLTLTRIKKRCLSSIP